jgi:hypothetical protein
MANFCENTLNIQGTKNDVDRVIAFVRSDTARDADGNLKVLDFNKIVPYPKRLEVLDRAFAAHVQHGGSLTDAPPSGYDLEGYDWCVEHWGTKWNASDAALEQMWDGVCFIFRTAWTPPLPVMLELARRFPSVSFSLEYSLDDRADTVVVDFAP